MESTLKKGRADRPRKIEKKIPKIARFSSHLMLGQIDLVK